MYYPAIGRYGVATRYHLASRLGLEILRNGGNVFDAAITISSILSIVIPHTGGLGGDAFILARLENGELIAYNGSGKSPMNFPSDEFIRLKPRRGGLTVSVPGLVDTWNWLNEEYGSIDLKELLKPAILLAENGFYTPYQLYKAIEIYRDELSGFKKWNTIFGDLKAGDYIRFRRIAWILRKIGRYGRDGFYTGEVAEKLVDGLKDSGAPVSVEDFEKHSGYRFKPIKLYYGDGIVYELPPNTQGVTTLEILAMMKEAGLDKEDRDATWWDKYMKLAAAAYHDRDKYIGDPNYMSLDPTELINIEHIKSVTSSIELGAGDTTFFTLSDKYGNILGFVQSIFLPFGSGLVSEEVIFQNRLVGFRYEYGFPNSPAPGKRPLHTLSISMIDLDKEFYIVGCAGGDLRPQIHSQVISNIIDLKMDIASATMARRNMLIKWRDDKPAEAIYEDMIKSKYGRYIGYPSPKVGIVQTLKYSLKGYTEVYADVRGGGVALVV